MHNVETKVSLLELALETACQHGEAVLALKTVGLRTSLPVWWLGSKLPLQEAQVQYLVPGEVLHDVARNKYIKLKLL